MFSIERERMLEQKKQINNNNKMSGSEIQLQALKFATMLGHREFKAKDFSNVVDFLFNTENIVLEKCKTKQSSITDFEKKA
ncbi:hypothetical protein BpHYR1_005713 [Brachionus plicatilis]|uniref:Uncharacterized protein n=1 Tax=Brachionus plicatilis TaxID=10195 RepID=A0A3M7PBH1_BRAPC|nr:hypothetical protein BpHYR1_005713 [Brachionus plicatilis]